MELQLVSFEQAKALKELGFPQGKALSWYSKRGVEHEWTIGDLKDLEATKMYGDIDAPSLELVAKWLRKEKKIHIEPYVTSIPSIHTFYCKVYLNYKAEKGPSISYTVDNGPGVYNFGDYEKALSVGIDKAIEILKA